MKCYTKLRVERSCRKHYIVKIIFGSIGTFLVLLEQHLHWELCQYTSFHPYGRRKSQISFGKFHNYCHCLLPWAWMWQTLHWLMMGPCDPLPSIWISSTWQIVPSFMLSQLGGWVCSGDEFHDCTSLDRFTTLGKKSLIQTIIQAHLCLHEMSMGLQQLQL